MFRRKLLEEKLQENPTWPFTVNIITSQLNNEGIYTCSRLSKEFYYFFFGFFSSIVFMIILLVHSSIENQYFLILVFGMITCLLGMYDSRHRTYYEINQKMKMYFVKTGSNTTTHGLYNIYVRLVKIKLPSIQKQPKIQYQLFVKGYLMKSIFIAEMDNKPKLRLLGQYIAQNLNINYFDDSNTSEHHVIRHVK